jgi:putative sugar O-methyltransferase
MSSVTRSNTWKTNVLNLFENIDESFLINFRSLIGANKKLTSWSPIENSTRWYKFFLFSILEKKSEIFFTLYSRLKNIDLGNPIYITYNQLNINLDYLLSIEEYLNLNKIENYDEIKNIVEIGAGFGRTCHAILSLNDNIINYTIIDIPEMLNLSKIYLKKVIPEHFHKIRFISCENSSEYENIESDLVININSFQEIPPSTIKFYFDEVIDYSKYFYTRNAICKYSPDLFNIEHTNLQDVFEIGLCQETIDVFDKKQIYEMRMNYKKNYKPNENWKIIVESDDTFSFYYNTIYSKI